MLTRRHLRVPFDQHRILRYYVQFANPGFRRFSILGTDDDGTIRGPFREAS